MRLISKIHGMATLHIFEFMTKVELSPNKGILFAFRDDRPSGK